VGSVLGPVAASLRIGPAGGRLDAPDYGLAVVVPPGAFASEQLVTLQPIEAKAPGALGPAWRIGPEGVTATKPITLEWQVGALHRRGTANLRIATQGADGVWRSSKAGSDDGEIVRAQTTHFSDWSLVAGSQLLPRQAEVALGQSLALSVVHCARSTAPGKPDELLHHSCGANMSNEYLANWAVNGVPGGSGALGSLTGIADPKGSQRSYVAPAALPSVNPVAVSVDDVLPEIDGQPGVQRLVSNITVIDPTAGCEWLRGVQGFDFTLEVDYRWAGSDSQWSAELGYRARAEGRLQIDPITPHGSTWFRGDAAGSVELSQVFENLLGVERIEVNGKGSPLSGVDQPNLRAMVNLQDCKLLLSGYLPTPARHVRSTPQGSHVMEAKHSGLAVVVTDYVVAGRHELGQERLLPALMGERNAAAYVAPDTHHRFEGRSGSARVRWSLKPR
jgi:hypothetical protein